MKSWIFRLILRRGAQSRVCFWLALDAFWSCTIGWCVFGER